MFFSLQFLFMVMLTLKHGLHRPIFIRDGSNRNIYNEHLRFEALKAEISEKKKEGEDVVFRYKCFFCGDLFKSERMLGVHVDAYHDFRCSWCGTQRQRFVSEKTFHTHVSKCHSRGGNPGKRFSGKRDMFSSLMLSIS